MRSYRLHARDDGDDCGAANNPHTWTGLRIASIFIILVTSLFGALFPVLARRQRLLRLVVPERAFKVAKYFGSGVIVSRPRSRFVSAASLTVFFRLRQPSSTF